MYTTILVPLDHSSADPTILRHVRGLASAGGARIVLLHIADGYAARYQKSLNLDAAPEFEQDRAYLEARAEELRRDGVRVSVRLGVGEPVAGILEAADAEHADLIAMATHGHGFVQDVLRGSVADALRHRTDLPVLMLRSKAT